jgi:hypothetical protein
MDKNLEKLEEDQEGAGVCECDRAQETCDRAHQRSSAQEEDRTHLRPRAKERDRSQCDRSQPECDRAHLCVKPKSAAALFWKFLILGFCNSLSHKDSNPTIFRVSRILLESINKPVNIEETRYFGEEFTAFKEAIFRVYSFPLFYFMKMISINFMCN